MLGLVQEQQEDACGQSLARKAGWGTEWIGCKGCKGGRSAVSRGSEGRARSFFVGFFGFVLLFAF